MDVQIYRDFALDRGFHFFLSETFGRHLHGQEAFFTINLLLGIHFYYSRLYNKKIQKEVKRSINLSEWLNFLL